MGECAGGGTDLAAAVDVRVSAGCGLEAGGLSHEAFDEAHLLEVLGELAFLGPGPDHADHDRVSHPVQCTADKKKNKNTKKRKGKKKKKRKKKKKTTRRRRDMYASFQIAGALA